MESACVRRACEAQGRLAIRPAGCPDVLAAVPLSGWSRGRAGRSVGGAVSCPAIRLVVQLSGWPSSHPAFLLAIRLSMSRRI